MSIISLNVREYLCLAVSRTKVGGSLDNVIIKTYQEYKQQALMAINKYSTCLEWWQLCKRGMTSRKFNGCDTKAPNVRLVIISCLFHHFRCHPAWLMIIPLGSSCEQAAVKPYRADKSLAYTSFTIVSQRTRDTKITQEYSAIMIHQ